MLNGIGLDRETEPINKSALELERVESFLKSYLAPHSFSDEVNEFFRELAALKSKSVEETIQETMTGVQKYLEAVKTEIAFKNDLPVDIDKYVEKLEKLAAGIESCWDILSEENRDFFIHLASAFAEVATSKFKGIRVLGIRFKLFLLSLPKQENLFKKYLDSFLIIPKAVQRAMALRQSKSTVKLQETAKLLLARAKEINTADSSLFGRTSEERLEKNQVAMAWEKVRLEEIKNKRNGNLEKEELSGKNSLVSDEKLRAIAYSMDALIPGFYCWFGPLKIRIGGSEAEDNYPGIIHSFAGAGLVLPNYQIYTTYQGSYDPR